MTSHSAVNVYNYVVIIIMFVVLSIGILDLLQLHEICSKTTLSVPMAQFYGSLHTLVERSNEHLYICKRIILSWTKFEILN